MIEKLLASCLRPVLDAEIQLRRRRIVIGLLCFGALTFLAFIALAQLQNWWSWEVVIGLLGFLAIVGIVALVRAGRDPDWKQMARKIEDHHPDLNVALLTALDQKPDSDGNLSYFQRRLLEDVSGHAVQNRWVRKVSQKRLTLAGWGQVASVVGFCLSVWILMGFAPGSTKGIPGIKTTEETEDPQVPKLALTVSPGDVELEKGSRLVVEGSFTGRAPAAAQLVMTTEQGEKLIPMNVGLDDTVFSALVPRIDLPGKYSVRFENESSEDYSINVFEIPKLVQTDVTITPPAFLEKDPETIEDTRKITVMEESRLDWRLKVNKPITMGELFGEDETSIPLEPSADDPTVLVASQIPTKTQRYRVHLVDDQDRGNRRPPWITVNVKRNQPPKLKLLFPGKDFEVSAVQELPLEAEIWDDVQVETVGLAYQFEDKETSLTLSTDPLAGEKKHVLGEKLDLEPLGVEPRDLITYYFWAEDRDNDGNLRRTTSDMFFAEVRFFEEIVREGTPPPGGQGEPGESEKLLELQKEVINAAWKLRRDHDLGRVFDLLASDVEVVRESQGVVLTMIESVIEEAEDPELKQIFLEARELMAQAVAEFALVIEKKNGDLISPAHQTARSVFAKLIEARSREQEISMSKSESASGSQQEQQRNMNLELEQKELKYEEKSQAQMEQQTAEQKENLAVLSRLKELARRQEAVAEKIKELENQMQNASEEEKAEIERQLKRLEEEQRDLLREVDDLSERMDSEENRSQMTEEKEQLDKTRENIKETAEDLSEGNLADAANSATRASRELEEIEEEFRERTSRQFAEEMRGLRETARKLAESQTEIGKELGEMNSTKATDPYTADAQKKRGAVAQEIAKQSRELSDLVEDIKKLSEESEVSEPILSDALYEAVRTTLTSGTEESLEEARDMTFYNRPEQALTSQQAAARGIENLKDAIEEAADKVLGNEADSLRLARSELDRLIDASKDEAQRLAEEGANGEAGDPSESGEPSTQPGEGESGELAENGESQRGASGEPGEEGKAGSEPSENGQSGERQAQSDQEGQPGEGKELGQGQSSQMAENGTQPGEGQSPGQGEGESQEQGEGEGQGQSQAQSESQGQGQGEGQGQSQAQSESQGQGQSQAQSESQGQGQGEGQGQSQGQSPRRGGLSLGGDDRGSGMPTDGGKPSGPLFFQQQSEQRNSGPITGEDYTEFRDRLGNIEEMLPQEDLRNAAARVADNAREMRVDFSRDNLPPGANAIEQKITDPLIELRQRVSEEIAKLNKENPIAPVDRDPVPSEFRDLVRRYYEELGSGN